MGLMAYYWLKLNLQKIRFCNTSILSHMKINPSCSTNTLNKCKLLKRLTYNVIFFMAYNSQDRSIKFFEKIPLHLNKIFLLQYNRMRITIYISIDSTSTLMRTDYLLYLTAFVRIMNTFYICAKLNYQFWIRNRYWFVSNIYSFSVYFS